MGELLLGLQLNATQAIEVYLLEDRVRAVCERCGSVTEQALCHETRDPQEIDPKSWAFGWATGHSAARCGLTTTESRN